MKRILTNKFLWLSIGVVIILCALVTIKHTKEDNYPVIIEDYSNTIIVEPTEDYPSTNQVLEEKHTKVISGFLSTIEDELLSFGITIDMIDIGNPQINKYNKATYVITAGNGATINIFLEYTDTSVVRYNIYDASAGDAG